MYMYPSHDYLLPVLFGCANALYIPLAIDKGLSIND